MAGVVEFNLHDWMPGHGENRIDVRPVASDLELLVLYDGREGEETKSLIFRHVSFYSVGAFPGVGALSYKYDVPFDTGRVIRATDSDFSRAWRQYWIASNIHEACNHYVMFWGSENKVIHVIAESVELS